MLSSLTGSWYQVTLKYANYGMISETYTHFVAQHCTLHASLNNDVRDSREICLFVAVPGRHNSIACLSLLKHCSTELLLKAWLILLKKKVIIMRNNIKYYNVTFGIHSTADKTLGR